jgi:hypothetical protein
VNANPMNCGSGSYLLAGVEPGLLMPHKNELRSTIALRLAGKTDCHRKPD